ncbi:MAG: tRNA pseudouridine(55) synthase TruB, partial [Gammaproteobacteria bacterium RIFCSPHIGHO2_12_FULL_43_28]
AGMTSNSALQKVKRLFNAKKAGHTGSLDPIATGMLPICFGEATKFSQFLLDSDKVYLVTAKLGIETTTGDSEGDITATCPVEKITQERFTEVMRQFIGTIEQVPPMYSAIKHQGTPLYELARKGIEVERKSREIRIHSLSLENVANDEVTFRVHCTKGTYVRTLVADIGKVLACGAHVIQLRRLAVTPYSEAPMYTMQTLAAIMEREGQAGLQACLLPVETSVQIFPAVKLSQSAVFYLRTGQSVRATFPIGSSLVRLMSDDSHFLGMGEVLPDGRIKPHRMLSTHEKALLADVS